MNESNTVHSDAFDLTLNVHIAVRFSQECSPLVKAVKNATRVHQGSTQQRSGPRRAYAVLPAHFRCKTIMKAQ